MKKARFERGALFQLSGEEQDNLNSNLPFAILKKEHSLRILRGLFRIRRDFQRGSPPQAPRVAGEPSIRHRASRASAQRMAP